MLVIGATLAWRAAPCPWRRRLPHLPATKLLPAANPSYWLYMTHNHAQSIPVNEAIIAEFQESHPNVKITFDNAPHSNFEQKVLTAFAGGTGPDVFWAGDWMIPQFVANGIVAPVDPTAFGVQTQEEFADHSFSPVCWMPSPSMGRSTPAASPSTTPSA